jgi:hypothetical protein
MNDSRFDEYNQNLLPTAVGERAHPPGEQNELAASKKKIERAGAAGEGFRLKKQLMRIYCLLELNMLINAYS